MHPIQRQLLALARAENLAQLTLREIARRIGMRPESPQKVKHHLGQLEQRGFLSLDRGTGQMTLATSSPGWAKGLLESSSTLFSVPIVGTANCGPATIYAEQNITGFLRVSSKLVGRSKPTGLYAIKADGASMNAAEIDGRRIDDGDFVIVDGRTRTPRDGDIVVAIIESRATIKEFVVDRHNQQVVLRARSTFDYEPIHLHADDDFLVSGKVVAVIKRPRIRD